MSCIQLNVFIIYELGHVRSFLPENCLTLSILFRMSVLPRPVTSRLSHINRTPCSLLPPRPSFWLVLFEVFFDFLVWSSSGMAATGRFAFATLDSLCLKAVETSHHSSGTSREYSKLVYESYHLQGHSIKCSKVVAVGLERIRLFTVTNLITVSDPNWATGRVFRVNFAYHHRPYLQNHPKLMLLLPPKEE